MALLQDLQRDLDRALAAGDLGAAAQVRRTIADGHPDTPQGAEARYRLGLHLLFQERNLDAAAEAFRAAAKAKQRPWSGQARVSLGLVMLRQGKHQQAIFELRRVASAEPPTLVSAQAAGLVVLGLKESGKGPEAERARTSYLKLLDTLVRTGDELTRPYAQLMLGMEHKHDGRRDLARPLLEAAAAADSLPDAERTQAQAALQEI